MGEAAEDLTLREQIYASAGMDDPDATPNEDTEALADAINEDVEVGEQEDTDGTESKSAQDNEESGEPVVDEKSGEQDAVTKPDADQQQASKDDGEEDVQAGPSVSEIKPPQALTGDRKNAWKELDPKWQNEIVRLENAQQKGVQKLAADANYGQTFKSIVDPYRAAINAAGVDEQTVISRLLNANYVLKTGSPAEKAHVLSSIAKEYQVPLQDLSEPVNIDPQMQYLIDQNRQMQQQFQNQQATAQQQVQQEAFNAVETFAADPENEHYEIVKDQMADLIESSTQIIVDGQLTSINTLEDAYKAACQLQGLTKTEPTLPAQDTQTVPTQKTAPKQPKVDAKKKAAVSVKSTGGSAAKGKAPAGESLRDSLARQIHQTTERL